MKPRAVVLTILVLIEAAGLVPLAFSAATLSPQETVNLYTGSELVVQSDQPSIQKVVVRGNLTAASLSTVTYPAKNFTMSSNATEAYTVNLLMSYPGAYTATIAIRDPTGGSMNKLSAYFVSGGDLNLTITATFLTRPGTGPTTPLGWSSFYEWIAQFGAAFPLWIRVLYLVLGVQFAFVGYRWMKFEDERRRLEGHLPPLDRGNKVYLSTDILFRALLTGFVISLAIMVGEAVVIMIAKYLFFIDLSIIQLLDLFSLFFVAALGSLVYLTREALDKLFDLKPLMED